MNNNKLIPLSIIIAVVIVSFSFIQTRDISLNIFKKNQEPESKLNQISKIHPDEPILGNPKASIFFIEYSDTECPISSMFAKERERIISLYAETGQIAWVYRSLPLINEASFKKGLALECVAEENKNHNFWNYLLEIQDKNIYDPQSSEIDLDLLMEPLKNKNLLTDNIINCINEERYADKLTNNIKEAVDNGAIRTPFTVILLSKEISKLQEEKIKKETIDLPEEIIIILPESKKILLNGKIPIEKMQNIIKILLLN